MPIADRKEAEDVLALVQAVAHSGRSGIELETLAPRVSIASTGVEQLLQKHTDYFVRVGGAQKFALNRFGSFNGSSERIIADVEQSYKQSERHKTTSLILLSVVGTLLGIIALMSLD